VDRDLDTICLKCLEKEPARRYESAAALADDLECWLRGDSVAARPAGRLERAWRWCRRHRVVAALGTAVAVSLLLGLVTALLMGWRLLAVNEDLTRALRQADDRLARLYTDKGVGLLEQGDRFGALVWLAEALRVEQHDPERSRQHGVRLAALLRQGPRLVQVFSPVRHADFSPDGKAVATVDAGGTVRVWEVCTGRALSPPLPHAPGVNHLAFSPDGKRIVTAGADKTARVGDAVTGVLLAPPLAHEAAVHWAEFSPDGTRVLTASGGWEPEHGIARLWDAATGQLLHATPRHAHIIALARFSPDGRHFVPVSNDDTIEFTGEARVWDVATG
jgi:eukaryotic-like serine/threonine-protein kinase